MITFCDRFRLIEFCEPLAVLFREDAPSHEKFRLKSRLKFGLIGGFGFAPEHQPASTVMAGRALSGAKASVRMAMQRSAARLKRQNQILHLNSSSHSGGVVIILLIVLILLFGFGGYRLGPGVGYYGGGTLSLILLIVLILLLLKVI